NPFKALVPLVPLAILFLTALPEPFRVFRVPMGWLLSGKELCLEQTAALQLYDGRLIGAAMMVGGVTAALTAPWSAGACAGAVLGGRVGQGVLRGGRLRSDERHVADPLGELFRQGRRGGGAGCSAGGSGEGVAASAVPAGVGVGAGVRAAVGVGHGLDAEP